MHTATELSPQWHRWIRENLQRGCSRVDMARIMVEARFDTAHACGAIKRIEADVRTNSGTLPVSPPAPPYLYEAGRLPWRDRLIRADDRDVVLAMRLERPALALFENVLAPEECEALIALAGTKLQRSEVVLPGSGGLDVSAARTSFGAAFGRAENELIARVERRIAALMRQPGEHGEGLQVLNYRQGGQYTPHFDYFPPADAVRPHCLAAGGQRISTLILYLNDVASGGETIFPAINLAITPRKGAALYFEYCNSHGQVDPATLHGGAPVTAGEKWIATKWMRQGRYA